MYTCTGHKSESFDGDESEAWIMDFAKRAQWSTVKITFLCQICQVSRRAWRRGGDDRQILGQALKHCVCILGQLRAHGDARDSNSNTHSHVRMHACTQGKRRHHRCVPATGRRWLPSCVLPQLCSRVARGVSMCGGICTRHWRHKSRSNERSC